LGYVGETYALSYLIITRLASTMDVLYKIRKGHNENDPYLIESKVVTGNIERKSEDAFEVVFEEPPLLM
jgi:hypothetical protein